MQNHTTLMSQECTTKQICLESIDAVMATIKNPFNQVDYEVYAKHEQVLLLAATKNCYSSKLRRLWTFTEMILASQTLKLSWRCSVKRKLNVPETQLRSRVFTIEHALQTGDHLYIFIFLQRNVNRTVACVPIYI